MAKQAKNLALGDSVALESDVAGKLDQGSAAPVFDDTVAYVSGYHVTYGGKLYRFTADHAAGAWTGTDVVEDNMTTPDATLDITSAGKLRVVAADGTILWTEPLPPVSSVNGETGAVVLDAADVGAATYLQIGIPEFESTATYAVGKLVMYSNAIWKCKTAITTAGAWNASKWNKILELSETNSIFPNAVTIGSRSGTVGMSSFAAGFSNVASGYCSSAEGEGARATASCSHAEGYSFASAAYSHAEGYNTHADGAYSHAEGYGAQSTGAKDQYSHAEGYYTTASGVGSHAEGEHSRTSGEASHAEGYTSSAAGYYSHAEGRQTSAKGGASHAEGYGTTAENQYEHAQGYYNASHKANTTWGNPGNTLSSVGFGESDACRNAVETMQDGKTFIYNLGGYDGTNPTGSGVKDIATAINDKAEAVDLRYAVVTKTPTVSSGTASMSLDDRACNSASTTAATVSLTFPAVINGRARDFLLLLDTTGSSSAPTLAYASYMTIVADEDADLTPIVGQNLYTFTEVARNVFAATRTTLVTIAEQVPQDTQGLISAASQAGYDMTNVSTPGQLATALGLTNSADFEDCANKVMFG